MFGKRSMFKSIVAIAVAASFAVVGAKTATADNSYNPYAYVHGGASQPVSRAIQSAGVESQRFVTSARNLKRARAQGSHLITDTLGGNGTPTQPTSGGGGLRNTTL
jgi:hypothetical protein